MKFFFLPINLKLMLGFSLVIIITLIVGTFSIIKLKDHTLLTKTMLEHPYAVSNSVKNIHIDILSIHSLTLSLLIYNDSKAMQTRIDKIKIHEESIKQNFMLISEQYLGPKEDVEKSHALFINSNEIRKVYLNILIKEGPEEAKDFLVKKSFKHLKHLKVSIRALNRFADHKANELLTQAKREEQRTIKYLYFMIFLSIVLSIFISIKTTSWIINPINNLLELTNDINNGNLVLSEDVVAKFSTRQDEIGMLFNSFYKLISYLLLPYKDIIKSDRSLSEKTDELRRLLNSFDKYIIASKTDIYGRITYVSQAAQKTMGYTSEELIGKTHGVLLHPDTSKNVFEDLWATIKDGKTW